MDKVRVGFVGVGGMGQMAHLKNYMCVPDCEVVAVSDVKKDQAEKVAAKYGIAKAYSSGEEMLAAEKLDAIVASQPFSRHGVLLPELYKAGVPVFTEKPIASSVAVGEKIVAALKSSSTWHMVGYHKRSDPASMYAREKITQLKESGELGKMKYVRLVMPPGDWVQNGFNGVVWGTDPVPPLEFDPPASDMDAETFKAYDAFVNYYIHQVNLMRYFLGEPYKVAYSDPSGVLPVGQSESGVACTIEMATYQNTIDWQESAFIAFQKGWIKVELPSPMAQNRAGRVTMYRDPGGETTPEMIEPTMPSRHAMMQQAMNFVSAVKGDIKPLCEAPEALEDLYVAREYIRLLKGV